MINLIPITQDHSRSFRALGQRDPKTPIPRPHTQPSPRETNSGHVDDGSYCHDDSLHLPSRENSAWAVGLLLWNPLSRYSPLAIETPLNPGKQFLLLTVSREDKSHPLELDRCLVLSDTPEIRNQLEAGVAQNDSLRYPDPRSSEFIPD